MAVELSRPRFINHHHHLPSISTKEEDEDLDDFSDRDEFDDGQFTHTSSLSMNDDSTGADGHVVFLSNARNEASSTSFGDKQHQHCGDDLHSVLSHDEDCCNLSRHSDFTVRTSNKKPIGTGTQPKSSIDNTRSTFNADEGRRSIFNSQVQQKYNRVLFSAEQNPSLGPNTLAGSQNTVSIAQQETRRSIFHPHVQQKYSYSTNTLDRLPFDGGYQNERYDPLQIHPLQTVTSPQQLPAKFQTSRHATRTSYQHLHQMQPVCLDVDEPTSQCKNAKSRQWESWKAKTTAIYRNELPPVSELTGAGILASESDFRCSSESMSTHSFMLQSLGPCSSGQRVPHHPFSVHDLYIDYAIASEKASATMAVQEEQDFNLDSLYAAYPQHYHGAVVAPSNASTQNAVARTKPSLFFDNAERITTPQHEGDQHDQANIASVNGNVEENLWGSGTRRNNHAILSKRRSSGRRNRFHRTRRPHETLHAQSLLLGFTFAAVWSPSNLMAPVLTEMAVSFGFSTEQERDLYLGSYCALALGVFSIPLAAGIGILADIVSRKQLFCVTVTCGGAMCALTALSRSYWELLLCRLLNGGFMAGTVPVAFSLLGDLFSTEERNAASSGLTALMGVGIVLGQVYAGMVVGISRDTENASDSSDRHLYATNELTMSYSNSSFIYEGFEEHVRTDVNDLPPWTHAFFVSSGFTFFFAILCWFLVQEPVRGGKEKVLQDMIQAGTKYDRKLTWVGFLHAIRHNTSNGILLWHGFFSSLPIGVLFVFMNDYLSQECGFGVSKATFLVLVFGLGCAAGGILGGYAGQLCVIYMQNLHRHSIMFGMKEEHQHQGLISRIARSLHLLPLFMAVSTAIGILPFFPLFQTRPGDNGSELIRFMLANCWSFLGGLIASLPSVNVRPCLINVNPPETRGAALTAANLFVNLGRGIGPSCITVLNSFFQGRYTTNHEAGGDLDKLNGMSREESFLVTVIAFWVVSSILLLCLARALPNDQHAMESDLETYAQAAMKACREEPQLREEEPFRIQSPIPNFTASLATLDPYESARSTGSLSFYSSTNGFDPNDTSAREEDDMLLDVEGRRLSYFDGRAAQETYDYMKQGILELGGEIIIAKSIMGCTNGTDEASFSSSNASSSGDVDHATENLEGDNAPVVDESTNLLGNQVQGHYT